MDVMQRYSLHNPEVAFSCKRVGALQFDVNTRQSTDVKGVVRQVYGAPLAAQLVDVSGESVELTCKITCWCS